MDYEQFICAMIECTKKKLKESELVQRQEIMKNNGCIAVGLTIRKAEEKIAPIIYLEEYFESYRRGAQMEELAQNLIARSKNAPPAPHLEYETVLEFSEIKQQIVYKLVNAKKNEFLLKQVPHLCILDLAVIFYLRFPVREEENCSILIKNEYQKAWGRSVSELYDCAGENTQKLCPYVLCPLSDFFESLPEEAAECPMWVLTNQAGNNGAAAILYPGMPKKIWDVLGRNYYLLPATIHEFLIVPEDEDIFPEDLLTMVKEVNDTEIKKEEFLSDRIYYFDGCNITKI